MENLVIACLLFLFGIPAAYVVECLLLQERESHEGPFLIRNTLVRFPNGDTQKAALFDRIRKLFGVYTVEDHWSGGVVIWVVREERAEYFTCPFCLSFWVGLLFSIPASILFHLPILYWPVVHFGIATISRAAYRGMTGE